MSVQINFLTYNVGGSKDTQRLAYLSENRSFTTQEANAWYNTRSFHVVSRLGIYNYDADIICLQEFYGTDREKEPLAHALRQNGYTILGSGDLAIAYKTNRFVCKKTGKTEAGRGAFFAHLQENTSKKTICVVTDHVAGFSGKIQKYYTKALKQQPRPQQDPVQNRPWNDNEVKNAKANFPSIGDLSLASSLQALSEPWYRKFLTPDTPDLVVYGLDANSTDTKQSGLQNRLHPKRLQQMHQAGFVRDTKDNAPTIIDHSLDRQDIDPSVTTYTPFTTFYNLHPSVPMKYDYLFFRAGFGHSVRFAQSGALGPEPDQFRDLLSDHRPVYSTIVLSHNFSLSYWGVKAVARVCHIFRSLFSRLLSARKPSLRLEEFDAHFKAANANYSFLKTDAGVSFGLLQAAKISPQELEGYFGELSLEKLLRKNPIDPQQFCEYFIVWCVMKKLHGTDFKIAFSSYEEYPKNLIGGLKTNVRWLLNNPTANKPCADYLKQYMQTSELVR